MFCFWIRINGVSTHSRPKAADFEWLATGKGEMVSTHSRPKAAEKEKYVTLPALIVSTHSRPKAADHAITPVKAP